MQSIWSSKVLIGYVIGRGREAVHGRRRRRRRGACQQIQRTRDGATEGGKGREAVDNLGRGHDSTGKENDGDHVMMGKVTGEEEKNVLEREITNKRWRKGTRKKLQRKLMC